MYTFDTDTLSLLWRGQAKVSARARQAGQSAQLTTNQVTVIEVLTGRFEAVIKASNAQELLAAVERLIETEARLSKFTILGIGPVVAQHFERLRGTSGLKKIGRRDLLIACIALAHDATLVTRNVKDFVPGLKVENWAD